MRALALRTKEAEEKFIQSTTGEKVKTCKGCGRFLSLTYSMSECSLCLMVRDEGGG